MIYDRFQQEAIDYINQGHSVIVSAPTGAGKTAIAEHIIRNSLDNHLGVIYTAPLKALSNQKFRDFQAQFQEQIGILTGDVSLNPEAPVMIMTTEIFRNKILDEPESLKRYSWVIFDEIHYIDNPERGTVWEESLIFLPKHMNILGLSATIPNIRQFTQWIESIHNKTVKIVIEENRPVPLHFFYQYHNHIVNKIEDIRRQSMGKINRIDHLIRHIHTRNGFPCIYFVFARKRTEDLAWELHSEDFLEPEEQKEILKAYDGLCQRFNLQHEKSASNMRNLVKKGIAYHHAGMLPTLKEVIERLFTSRLIKIIFTTETFALGINMPSRSVIFDDLRKFYGHYVRNLKVRDFYQMAGRSGRRGIDKEGFVFCRINLNRIKIPELKNIIYGRSEEVRSQLNNSYATILSLYEKYKDELFKIYPLSLHHFQSNPNQKKEALRLMQAKLKLLCENGFIENKSLTSKGIFAKNIYSYELLLSELQANNILEELDEFELAMLAVATVFEPRKNQHMMGLPKKAHRIKIISEDLSYKIKGTERRYRIYPFSKPAYFHLTNSMECWLQGQNFSNIMRYTDVDEGEVVRYFRMSVQILREINKSPVSFTLKGKLQETIRVINRDIINAEKQLREES